MALRVNNKMCLCMCVEGVVWTLNIEGNKKTNGFVGGGGVRGLSVTVLFCSHYYPLENTGCLLTIK